MPVKLAVFDIAGTTVTDNNAVATAFCKAFSSFGYAITHEDVTPLMGYKKTAIIRSKKNTIKGYITHIKTQAY